MSLRTGDGGPLVTATNHRGRVSRRAAGRLARDCLVLPSIHPSTRCPQPSRVAARGPSILVAPFENDDSDAIDSALVRGFTREVIIGLTRFDDLFVFGPATSFRYEGSGDLPGSAAGLPVDFVLTGGVMVSDNRAFAPR